MAQGKYLSLEEARKQGKFKEFAKQHEGEGDSELWERLFRSMAGPKTPPEAGPSSTSAGRDD